MNSYNVIGKYQNDTGEVVAYAVRNLNSGDIETYTKDTFSFLVGRKQILNCTGELANGKVHFVGVNCDFNNLPIKQKNEKFEDKSVNSMVITPRDYKVKAVIRDKLFKMRGRPEEIVLYQVIINLSYERNIQFLSYPFIERLQAINQEEADKKYKFKISCNLYFSKINSAYHIKLITVEDRASKSGYKYLLKIYNLNKELIDTLNIESYNTTTSPITSCVGTGRNVPIITVVEVNNTSKRIIEKLKERIGV